MCACPCAYYVNVWRVAQLEVGSSAADHTSTVVEFSGSYTDPVILAGIPTENGDEVRALLTLRVCVRAACVYVCVLRSACALSATNRQLLLRSRNHDAGGSNSHFRSDS